MCDSSVEKPEDSEEDLRELEKGFTETDLAQGTPYYEGPDDEQ